jgi:hypothetical protein
MGEPIILPINRKGMKVSVRINEKYNFSNYVKLLSFILLSRLNPHIGITYYKSKNARLFFNKYFE